MVHEAARQIARATRIPLIIDLRDPWSAVEQVAEDHASPIWYSVARRFERRAVRDAGLIIMNTEMARDDMRARYPSAARRIVAVANGSDDEPVPPIAPSSRFTIRFAGSIYLDRDPRLVFRASARVVRRLGLTPADFGVEFIGHVDDYGGTSVRTMASEEGLGGFVEVGGPRPRAAAMEFLAGATMLLNLPQGADLCVPAKIFEYVRFNAWLLVLARQGSATAETLRDTSADVIDPNDVDRIAEVIERRYLQYSRGERPVAVGHDGRFDRRIQAEQLVNHLEALIAPR
jgi:glycosyltransferase involved in cell wall biosynthesis